MTAATKKVKNTLSAEEKASKEKAEAAEKALKKAQKASAEVAQEVQETLDKMGALLNSSKGRYLPSLRALWKGYTSNQSQVKDELKRAVERGKLA